MTAMPALKTDRILIRPLRMADLEAIYRILDVELAGVRPGDAQALAARKKWLQWTILGYEQQAILHQPPYGERAVTLQATGELVGACGYAPCLDRFEQLPFAGGRPADAPAYTTPEFGLYYAISPAHQRRGYASEAAAALLDYAFRELGLRRVIATTTYDNVASIGVMKKLGMQIETNPRPAPPWLQVVGVISKESDDRNPPLSPA